jgi:hypothetical protein
MKCEECLPLIEEYVDGELDARTAERLSAHLSTCAACANEFTELKREQEIYSLYQRDVEVTPSDWNIISARIEQEKDARVIEPRAMRLSERLSGFFGSQAAFRPAFVAALLLVIAGIAASVIYLNSRSDRNELASQPPQPNQTLIPTSREETATPNKENERREELAQGENSGSDSSQRQTSPTVNIQANRGRQNKATAAMAKLPRSENPRVEQATPVESARFVDAVARDSAIASIPETAGDFDFEIARHAERAQMLLRSFRNARPVATNHQLDISYEKAQSRKLLYQNIALRRDAAARGDQATAELLNTLEPILLDIAHLPDRAKPQDVRSIEQRMEKKEIVATLQVRTLVAAN